MKHVLSIILKNGTANVGTAEILIDVYPGFLGFLRVVGIRKIQMKNGEVPSSIYLLTKFEGGGEPRQGANVCLDGRVELNGMMYNTELELDSAVIAVPKDTSTFIKHTKRG